MDLEQLCQLLEVTNPTHLGTGFASLLDLFPESSCESVQLVNVLLPLVLELLKPFYSEDVMVQANLYLYVEVILGHYFMCPF